jgi:hypothetical protein
MRENTKEKNTNKKINLAKPGSLYISMNFQPPHHL